MARGKPTRAEIREALSGNYCRCTGYQAIVDAIEAVAQAAGSQRMTDSRSIIGRSVPRPDAIRLAAGRGRYTDDIDVAKLGHVAFLRSPYPHARIGAIDIAAARAAPGVIAVVTGDDLAAICKPWQTQLALVPGHKSPPQYPLARDEVCLAGRGRRRGRRGHDGRKAEDAIGACRDRLERIAGDRKLAKPRPRRMRPPSTPQCRAISVSSIPFQRAIPTGRSAMPPWLSSMISTFGRQTGVTLEPRIIVAEFDPRLRQLTIHHSHQVPHQMREIFAAQLGLPLSNVRVVTPDVGGAFGMKLSAYPDEMAVAAIAVLLGRPVKFCADRLEVLCQRQPRARGQGSRPSRRRCRRTV